VTRVESSKKVLRFHFTYIFSFSLLHSLVECEALGAVVEGGEEAVLEDLLTRVVRHLRQTKSNQTHPTTPVAHRQEDGRAPLSDFTSEGRLHEKRAQAGTLRRLKQVEAVGRRSSPPPTQESVKQHSDPSPGRCANPLGGTRVDPARPPRPRLSRAGARLLAGAGAHR
jgi:hypothetical protein